MLTNEPTTVNLRPPVWLPILVVLIGGAFYIAGKNMEIRAPRENPLTISVSADAKVPMSPDIAVLVLGVTTGRQTTAKAASETIARQMTKVIAAVEAAGVKESDISTEHFSLNPEYDYTPAGQVPKGFSANQSITVKVRDLDNAGDVLTAATGAGANQVQGVSFSVDNPDAAMAEARHMAIEKAREKAEVLASNLDMSLGRMVGFSDNGYGVPPRPMMAKTMMGMDAGIAESIPLPSGMEEIVANVTLTYELR